MPAPPQRLTRTARYEWCRPLRPYEETIVHADVESRSADCPSPLDEDGALRVSLADGLRRWHLRAETAFRSAVDLGAAKVTRPAERDKGAAPTSRRRADTAPQRARESISARRLHRIHRCIAEAWRRGSAAHEPLPVTVQRRWASAAHDCLLPAAPLFLGPAADVLSRAQAEMRLQ